jgi:hypothetical protein
MYGSWSHSGLYLTMRNWRATLSAILLDLSQRRRILLAEHGKIDNLDELGFQQCLKNGI